MDDLPIPTLKEDEDDIIAVLRNWTESRELICLQHLYRKHNTRIDDLPRKITEARKREAVEKRKE